MRINQAFVGVRFFKTPFLKKFKLVTYHNKFEPSIFFGLYHKQQHILVNHKSTAVIVWAGSDAIHLKKCPDLVSYIKNSKHIFNIAISNFIEKDLDELGIPYYSIPITPHINNGIKPERLGRCIYMYTSIKSPQVYGTKFIPYIKRSFPRAKIILATKDTYSREELFEIYKKCFLGLRLTKHDGLSNTVSELGLMGRKVVWNGNTPNAIHYRTVDDIVRIIENESKNINKFTPEVGMSVKEYLDINDDWLDTDFYKGKKSPKREIKIKSTPKPEEIFTASVIINTYNDNEDKLKKAIESYRTQIGVELQLIISTVKGDNSIEVAKQYKGVEICVSDKPGIYEQLNKAIKLVKSDWFSYASGNDVATPTKLLEEIECCIKNNKKICYSNFYHTDENLKVTRTTSFHDYNYKVHLKENFVNDCATIHKSLLDKYAPFKLEWGNYSFYDFWLRIYEGEGDVFVYNPKPTWKYIISNESLHIKRKRNTELRDEYESLKQEMIKSHERVK